MRSLAARDAGIVPHAFFPLAYARLIASSIAQKNRDREVSGKRCPSGKLAVLAERFIKLSHQADSFGAEEFEFKWLLGAEVTSTSSACADATFAIKPTSGSKSLIGGMAIVPDHRFWLRHRIVLYPLQRSANSAGLISMSRRMPRSVPIRNVRPAWTGTTVRKAPFAST